MPDVAQLTIKVDVDGAVSTVAELKAVDRAIHNVGDDARHSSRDTDAFSRSLHKMGTSLGGAVAGVSKIGLVGGGIGGLIGMASSAVAGLAAIAGGAVVAAGGMVALAGGTAFFGAKALEAATGTDSLGEAIGTLTEKGGALGEAYGKMQDAIKAMGPEVLRGVTDFGNTFLNEVTTWIGRMRQYIEPLFSEVGDLFSRWGDLFGRALDKIDPSMLTGWIDRISGAFESLFATLIPMMSGGMNNLLRVLEGLGRGIEAIVKAGQPLMDMIGIGLAKGLTTLGTQIGKLATAYGPSLKILLDGLQLVFKQLGTGLTAMAPGFEVALGALVDAIGQLDMATIGEAFGTLLTAISKLFGPIASLINFVAGLVDAFGPLLPFVAGAALALVGLSKALGLVTSAIKVVGMVIEFTSALIALNPVALAVVAAIGGVVAALYALQHPLSFLKVDLNESNQGLQEIALGFNKVTVGGKEVTDAMIEGAWGFRDHASAAEQDAAATQSLAEANAHAAQTARDLFDAQMALVGGMSGIANTMSDLSADQAKLNTMQENGKKGTKAYHEQQQAVLDDFLQLAGQVDAYKKSLQEQGLSTRGLTKDLRAMGERLGLSKEFIDGIIGRFHKGANAVDSFRRNTDGVKDSGEKAAAALDLMAKQRKLQINSQQAREAQGAVDDLSGSIKKVPDKKDVNINTNAAGEKAKVDGLKRSIDSLHDKTITLTVLTRGYSGNPNLPAGQAAQEGGWRGLHGPEMVLVGEKEPELIIPKSHMKKHGTAAAGLGSGVITGTLHIVDWERGIAEISATTQDDVEDDGMAFRARMARMKR